MDSQPAIGRDERAVAPAVGKTLEVGLVVLFVGLVTGVLLGGVVPEYRAAAGDELGDRVLATASQEIERAVPAVDGTVDVRRAVDLPASIAGESYEIRVDGRWLVLDHPRAGIGGRVRPTVAPRVDRIEGRWESDAEATVRVRGGDGGFVVELRDGGRP